MIELRLLHTRNALGVKGSIIQRPKHIADDLLANGLCELVKKENKSTTKIKTKE